jgi:hypothetical protein
MTRYTYKEGYCPTEELLIGTLSCLRGRCFTHVGMDLTYETLLLPAKREFPSFEATHVSILSPAMSTSSMSQLHSICWVFRYPQNLAPRTGFR